MTAQLFPVLFDMSLGASFVIAAVLLLRLLCHRFPRRYFLILWAVVLLRLLCPILPESELSMIPPATVSFAKETALPERSEVTVLSAADAAMRAGGTLPGVMSAANDIAVEKFLAREISFGGIWRIIEKVMNDHKVLYNSSLEEILAVDRETRIKAREVKL